ncbi:MAG: ABC transporter permease [Candidatus Acidiferrales bacterium]
MWRDLRHAWRRLSQSPGSAAIIVLTLGLGIGAVTAIFSVVSGVLLSPLPYPDPDRIVQVWEVGRKGQHMQFADPNFADLHAMNASFSALAQFDRVITSVGGGAQPVRVQVSAVSKDFFSAMGVHPAMGRDFSPEELREGAPSVAVVGYGFWQRELGSAGDFSNHPLSLNGKLTTVVGVMPRGFSFPPATELWTPREQIETLTSRTAHNWRVIGRLKPQATLEQARAELGAIAQRIKRQYGEYADLVDAAVIPLQEQMVGPIRPALLILLGAVGFLLLIAWANVANLLLAQATSRQREMAVRVALGAGRGRLMRQFVAEALLLSLAGGALGILIATWGVDALLAAEPGNLPRVDEIHTSWAVLLFAAGASIVTAAALGLFTAYRATRVNLETSLRESQSSQSGRVSSHRLRAGLVISQVAIALMLLTGAGLLGKSFLRLLEVNPGFRVSSIVAADLSEPPPDFQDATAKTRLVGKIDNALARFRAIPGVEDVGAVDGLPLTQFLSNGTFLLMHGGEKLSSWNDFERLAHDPSRAGNAEYRVASEGYFSTMGIPLQRGRLFNDGDSADTPHVAVISESLARLRWPASDPIGQQIEFGNMDGDPRFLTIVGIVGNVRLHGLAAPPEPVVYVNYRQRPQKASDLSIVMQGSGDSTRLISTARGILHELDPEVPVQFRTIEQVVSSSVADRRFLLLLLGTFSGAALILAAMGIFGVMAYVVSQRTHELGIRFALGATPRDIGRLVLGEGFKLAVAGVSLGVLAAAFATRVLGSILYQTSTSDPWTFAGVAFLLTSVALLACYIPARRATRVDPLVALRHE